MNKLIFSILTFLFIFVLACKNGQNDKVETQTTSTKNEPSEKNIQIESEILNPKNENQDLIDIEKESKIKSGDYFLNYKGNNISLCCKQELYNPFGGLDMHTIKRYLTDFKFKIDTTEYAYHYTYSKNNSVFIIVELIPEKSGEEGTFIGKGKLLDKSVTLSRGIKIGMDKKDLLDMYFYYTDKIINDLNQIAVCEDEKGELYTKYKFKDDKLTEIEFGSADEK